jgi:RNA polymerase sigma-70 factor (ECF subfamily)
MQVMTIPVATQPEQRLLVAAAQAGDERAFRELVEPYRRALEIHCYRMLGSPHDAEDVVQETLLRAWRGLDRFERRAGIKTWLYRIATNACLDEIERRPRRLEPVEPYPDAQLDEAAAPIADPAARYAQREGMELAFLTTIRRLPGRQRAVLILRDVLGWTAPEVAELLETTVSSVTSALQRARETVDRELPATRAPVAEKERALLRRYVTLWERVDVDGLVALLREDAAIRMPPGRAVAGRAAIGDFWRGLGGGCAVGRMRVVPAYANRMPALAMYRDGEPHGIMVLTVEDGAIAAIDAFIDPELPARFAS